VTLTARWVTLTARWVTLTARWVTLTARWVTLTARWVTFTTDEGAGAGTGPESGASGGEAERAVAAVRFKEPCWIPNEF
jgi:hypothetical protein